jgi:hypothetical protein
MDGAALQARGDTLLTYAVRHGQVDVARKLLVAGSDEVNSTTTMGGTALFISCQNDELACVQLLLDFGADAELPVSNGATPLSIACQEGNVDCVRAMIESGRCDIDAAKNDGATPLFVASQGNHATTVELICAAGASVDKAALNGGTPILVACQQGHLETVQLLSSYGASRAPVPYRPWRTRRSTPETLAERHGHATLLVWLRASRTWTPLHHLECLSESRARGLLRTGAALHEGSPSPLERAQASAGSASALLQRAAWWSEHTHGLFSVAARRRAVAVLELGYLLAWSRFPAHAASLVDCWRDLVLPHAIADEVLCSPRTRRARSLLCIRSKRGSRGSRAVSVVM